MGNVRSEKVKKIARELIKKYPDKFTANFEENKKILSSLVLVPSAKLRNSIAGYITRLVAISQQSGRASTPLNR